MRKVISIIILISMLGTFLVGCSEKVSNTKKNDKEVEQKDNGVSRTSFEWDIFKELNKEDSDKNIFISPLSISTAIGMVYQGANGETQNGIQEALGYKDMDKKQINEEYKEILNHLKSLDKTIELDINNSIWIKDGEEIKKEFIKTNKEFFNADVRELDFKDSKSADEINNWIEESTKGKINNIIKPPIPEDTIMYLFNAIYFKGSWTDKFDPKLTFETQFNGINNEKSNIDMMAKIGNVDYTEGEDYKAVRLPYGEKKLSMYIILPNEEIEIGDFIDEMNFDKWEDIKDTMYSEKDLNLQIPKFKLEYGVKELNSSLSKLGMKDVFNRSADFSGIGEKVYLDNAFHKAVIEVDEDGSEAAAITGIEIRTTSIMESKSFVADRPFIFLISDEESDSVLFMGKILNL